ncbi:hypothetical protein HCB18_27485 [Salinispora arenicola]|nr:hypothetical protein [Salinispora arenicola]
MSHRPGDLPDCEMIVGPLIATVPIRSHVRPDLTVREWLQALQATIIGAREHAGVSLPEIRACADAPPVDRAVRDHRLLRERTDSGDLVR